MPSLSLTALELKENDSLEDLFYIAEKPGLDMFYLSDKQNSNEKQLYLLNN